MSIYEIRVKGHLDQQWSCIGYLAHPFEKKPKGLSSPASFLLSGGTQPSIRERNLARSLEKTLVPGQQTMSEGIQRLYERPVTDLFRLTLRAGLTWSSN